MVEHETPKATELTTADNNASLKEAGAETGANKLPTAKKAALKGVSPPKKSVPKKKVPPKKKAAPRKTAMPKKQRSTKTSTSARAITKPSSRRARAAKSIDSTEQKNQDTAHVKFDTKLHPGTTNTRFWGKTGIWLGASLAVIVGATAYYFLGISTDSSDSSATVVEAHQPTRPSEKQLLEKGTAEPQVTATTEDSSLDHPIAKEAQEQHEREAANTSRSIEVMGDPKVDQRLSVGHYATPREETQTTKAGVTALESTTKHPSTAPIGRSETTRDQRSAAPISESQSNITHSQTNPNQSMQSPASVLSSESESTDTPVTATQAQQSKTATKPTTTPLAGQTQGYTPSTSIKSDQHFIVPGVNPISSAVTRKVEPNVAKQAPEPTQAPPSRPRYISPVQRPATYLPKPPWDQPQMWPHPSAVAPPYGWGGPYGFPGGIAPYPMDPRYSTYRRPPSDHEE